MLVNDPIFYSQHTQIWTHTVQLWILQIDITLLLQQHLWERVVLSERVAVWIQVHRRYTYLSLHRPLLHRHRGFRCLIFHLSYILIRSVTIHHLQRLIIRYWRCRPRRNHNSDVQRSYNYSQHYPPLSSYSYPRTSLPYSNVISSYTSPLKSVCISYRGWGM